MADLKSLDDYWKTKKEATKNKQSKIQFVNFVDGQPEIIEIKNWKVFTWEYVGKNWDNAELIKTEDGRVLKINNQSLNDQLEKHIGKHVILDLTRYDSEPSPLKTRYVVRLIEDVRKSQKQKQTVKSKS